MTELCGTPLRTLTQSDEVPSICLLVENRRSPNSIMTGKHVVVLTVACLAAVYAAWEATYPAAVSPVTMYCFGFVHEQQNFCWENQ